MFKFNKKFWFWFVVGIILIGNIFFTYFGRKYFPENFNPQHVTFIENYFCLLVTLCIFALILVDILVIIVLFVKFAKELFNSNKNENT